MSKHEDDDDEYREYPEDEDDAWSEMSPERSPYESDEDYRERMENLENYGEN